MQGSSIAQTSQVLSLFIGGKETLPLHAGEIVTAEVMRSGADNSATIKVKNTVLNVQTDVQVHKGDLLTLRVERQENTVYLRLAGQVSESDSVEKALQSVLSRFEGLGSGTEGMARLISSLASLPQTIKAGLPEIDLINRFLLEMTNVSGKTLRDAVENGGVFFEAKLRILALGMEAEGDTAGIEAGRIIANDLKGSLLKLKDALLAPGILESAKSRINPDELMGALNTVLHNIEYYQVQSKLTDSLQFFLPLVWKQLRDGEIIMKQYQHGKPGEHSSACTVNLDLERVGKVRVHLLVQNRYVHVTCAAENSEMTKLLQDGADLLKEQFGSAGIRLGYLSVVHQQKIDFEGMQPEGLSIRA